MAATAFALVMVLISALGYAGATVAMARLGAGQPPVFAAVVFLALALAVLAEITALRHLSIGVVYLAILGLETVIVLLAAAALGQALGPLQVAGAGMILTGTALLAASHG